jgi:hypothetical protein
MPLIRAHDIGVLDALPDELRTGWMLEHVTSRREARLLSLIHDHVAEPDKFVTSLKHKPNRRAFWSYVDETFKDGLGVFPELPTIDDHRIEAVKTAAELRRLGEVMKNCLVSFTAEAIDGEIGFYHLSGSEPAVISVRPRIGGQLVIEEINGASNQPVSKDLKASILNLFKQHGINECTGYGMSCVELASHSLRSVGGSHPDNRHQLKHHAKRALKAINRSHHKRQEA